MMLSYPDLPHEVLAALRLARNPHVSHLQRLHHRPAQAPDLRLLSTGPVLPRPGGAAPPGAQGAFDTS